MNSIGFQASQDLELGLHDKGGASGFVGSGLRGVPAESASFAQLRAQ